VPLLVAGVEVINPWIARRADLSGNIWKFTSFKWRDWMVRSKVFSLAMALCLVAASSSFLSAQTTAGADSRPCGNVTTLGSPPLSALPSAIQEEILSALKPSILSFAKATAKDLEEDFRLRRIKLDALQVAQTSDSGALYIVHWGLAEFGVNGAVWIVDVNSSGARNLVAPGEQAIGADSFSGYGAQVLSFKDPHYPEIMIASKSFIHPGAPVAQDECVRRTGGLYRPAPCPAHCFRNLNSK
jgi:hypothetical protein